VKLSPEGCVVTVPPPSTKAHPAKAGAAKPQVLGSSATPDVTRANAPKDP